MTSLTRPVAICTILLAVLFHQRTAAQSVIDPSDPVVEYNPLSPPAPSWDYFNPIVKWVRTKGIAGGAVQTRNGSSWNSDVYKAYSYNGLAFRVQFPKSYNPTANDGKKYPILIFLHGQGENCTQYLPPSYNYDNHYQLLQGPKVFDAAIQNGTYDGYILAPQLQDFGPGNKNVFYPGTLNDILNIVKYMIAHNKVDPFHIVVNGLSEGGLGSWDFLNQFPTYITSCTPMSSPITFLSDNTFIDNKRYTPIWCAQGSTDTHPKPEETKAVADSMTKYGVNFKETIYPGVGHGTWDKFWAEPGFWPFVNRSYTSNPWPLYGRNQFWPGEHVDATIGVNKGFEAYEWRRDGSPLPDADNEIHVNTVGVYDARVQRDGIWSDWSHVPVTVKNNNYRVESEDWTAMSGVTAQVTRDGDGILNVASISNGDWMDYTIAPYLSGTYTLKLRIAAASSGAKLQVINSSNIVLATVTVTQTFGSQTWQTVSTSIPLAAGSQKIRIKSITNTTFNINWMEFSMTAVPSTLPVKFAYFNAQCKTGAVDLRWKTAQELNSLRFSVQRSTDGVNWSEIGTVAAAGQSTQERSYQFADKAPAASGMYRIVEYDYNGQTTISSIVRSNCSLEGEVMLYPNPSSGNAAVTITLQRAADVSIQVLDSRGALMQQRRVQLSAGTTSIPLNMDSYAVGIYAIRIQYNDATKTLKMIKK